MATNNEKMTYVSALTDLLEGKTLTSEHMEKISALRDQLAKRASNASLNKKPTKTQQENEHYRGMIVALMRDEEKRTITDIMTAIPMLNNLSSQRVNAIVTQMKTAGVLTREVIKRKAYFSLTASSNEMGE